MTTTTRGAAPEARTVPDLALVPAVVAVAQEAGRRLTSGFSPDARPDGLAAMTAAGRLNEEASLRGMREALAAVRPGADWVAADRETTELPAGEWWTVDAVEGNVNHVHGMPNWCVSIALLRDDAPVLAVVHQPVGELTYTAVRGAGSFCNGRPLRTSGKTELGAAIAATGQAEAGQAQTYRRLGDSITAMLGQALVVGASVPSTFPLLLVSAGQNDVFWQYEPVLPGIAAGILLATEAGGVASRIDGSPWRPGSPDVLVTAAGLHRAAVDVLAPVGRACPPAGELPCS